MGLVKLIYDSQKDASTIKLTTTGSLSKGTDNNFMTWRNTNLLLSRSGQQRFLTIYHKSMWTFKLPLHIYFIVNSLELSWIPSLLQVKSCVERCVHSNFWYFFVNWTFSPFSESIVFVPWTRGKKGFHSVELGNLNFPKNVFCSNDEYALRHHTNKLLQISVLPVRNFFGYRYRLNYNLDFK